MFTWLNHLGMLIRITLLMRMKHIALDYHFVWEKVVDGSLKVSHINTHSQLPDILTKPLSKGRFLFLRSKIGISDGTAILRGHIEAQS